VESTIYLRPDAAGRGLGTKLYSSLLAELRDRQLHVAIGGIALPNAASVALHEKLGFEKVAHFRQVGNKFDRWVDVGYWQLILGDTEEQLTRFDD
jgi:phosphinothricin acetyltransferase